MNQLNQAAFAICHAGSQMVTAAANLYCIIVSICSSNGDYCEPKIEQLCQFCQGRGKPQRSFFFYLQTESCQVSSGLCVASIGCSNQRLKQTASQTQTNTGVCKILTCQVRDGERKTRQEESSGAKVVAGESQ